MVHIFQTVCTIFDNCEIFPRLFFFSKVGAYVEKAINPGPSVSLCSRSVMRFQLEWGAQKMKAAN
jgi:hypothetical protein